MKGTSAKLILLALAIATSCADSTRENIVDPVVAPTVEIRPPVLDSGTVLVEWRYLSEGTELAEFRVTRTAGSVTEEVSRVQVTPTSDWQTLSIRDSTIVASRDVRYRVTGILADGSESTSASSSIRIDGTIVEPIAVDSDDLSITLRWTRPIEGTIGFDVIRTAPDGPEEIVFRTDDTSVRSYTDPVAEGDIRFGYELVTRLEGGGSIRSTIQTAGLFTFVSSVAVDTRRFGVRSLLYFDHSNIETTRILLLGVPPLEFVGLLADLVLRAEPRYTWDHPSLVRSSVSVSGPTSGFKNRPEPKGINYVLGIQDDGNALFRASALDAVSQPTWTWPPAIELTWPAPGATRTGVSLLGDKQTANTVITFVGTHLRVLDDSFDVVDEDNSLIEEPVDIDFVDGFVWLAFPSYLQKGMVSSSLSEMSWGRVDVPGGSEITAITQYKDRLLILDGESRRISLMSSSGEILLTWGAKGTDPEFGDIGTDLANARVYQSDRLGEIHVFQPQGE